MILKARKKKLAKYVRKRERKKRVIECEERERRRSLREGRKCLKSVFWKYQKHDMNWKGKQKNLVLDP